MEEGEGPGGSALAGATVTCTATQLGNHDLLYNSELESKAYTMNKAFAENKQ